MSDFIKKHKRMVFWFLVFLAILLIVLFIWTTVSAIQKGIYYSSLLLLLYLLGILTFLWALYTIETDPKFGR